MQIESNAEFCVRMKELAESIENKKYKLSDVHTIIFRIPENVEEAGWRYDEMVKALQALKSLKKLEFYIPKNRSAHENNWASKVGVDV